MAGIDDKPKRYYPADSAKMRGGTMEARKSDSLIQFIGTAGSVLEQLGDACADNLALHVAKLAEAAAPLKEGASTVVDGHCAALRSFAVASGVGAVLRENADVIGSAMAEASASGALADAFDAGLQAWEKHGQSIGVPFPQRGPDADFDPGPGSDCPGFPSCAPSGKLNLDLGEIAKIWVQLGGTMEGFFDAVDALKPAAAAAAVAP